MSTPDEPGESSGNADIRTRRARRGASNFAALTKKITEDAEFRARLVAGK